MGCTSPELVWEDGLMMFRGSGIKGMFIGPGNPHQSALPFLTISPTTLLPMSSVTFFDVEQTLGQHQLDNANTYLGVRELLIGDECREEEELDLIPTHLRGIYTCE